MILKLLLKIWPALTPILLYIFWIAVKRIIKNHFKKKSYIEGEFKEVKNSEKDLANHKSEISTDESKQIIGDFSLRNPKFIVIVYLSLSLIILSLIFFAF